MEPSPDADTQEKETSPCGLSSADTGQSDTQGPVGNGEPPKQPPVEESTPAPKPKPVPKHISRSAHHSARHRKPVAIQMCEICNIELVGQVVIDAHMKGNKHAKKLKARELLSHLIFKCEDCTVSFNSSQQLEEHKTDAKHIDNVQKRADSQGQDAAATQTNQPKDGTSDAQGSGAKNEKSKGAVNPLDLFCAVCSVTVNSPQQLEQHLGSKKHKDRESGRSQHRPAPYPRASRGGRGGRGGLGSQGGPGRGGKTNSGKYTSLSTSFKSAGYSNSFIKPEGGVIVPSNCGTNKGPNEARHHMAPHGNKTHNMGGHYKNRGNFGSLTPYINTEAAHGAGDASAGVSHAAWTNPAQMYGGYTEGYAESYTEGYTEGYSYDYTYAGYNYAGYENAEGYTEYGLVPPGTGPPGPPPTY